MVIEVCERIGDCWQTSEGVVYPMYHVSFKHNLGGRAVGRTVEGAIHDLIMAHPEFFPNGRETEGVRVLYIGRAAR